MIIYSVTIHIRKDAEQEWLEYMQQKHISEVLATGYLTSCSMRKALTEEVAGFTTYSMEYTAASREALETYRQKAAAALQMDVSDRFGGRFTAQRTVYEVIFSQ